MMAMFMRPRWTLCVEQDHVDVVSEYPTPDERWRDTDEAGHEHFYEQLGYPTLDLVIDAQHWCDGSEGLARHDPHMHVDASHYECRQCRVTIEPGLHPAGYVHRLPGLRTASLRGFVGHVETTITLTEDDVIGLRSCGSGALADARAMWLLENVPEERVISRRVQG